VTRTVLIVDDSVDTLAMLEMYLQACGFAVEKADSGVEAVEKAERCGPRSSDEVVAHALRQHDLSGGWGGIHPLPGADPHR
jgi:CheY-like chemotaxis protein